MTGDTMQSTLSYMLTVAMVTAAVAPAYADTGGRVEVESVVLRLLDEADAPAQRPGVLVRIRAKEGDRVQKGQVLGELDMRDAELAEQVAKLELSIAEEKASNDIQVRFAAKAHQTAAAELRRSEVSIANFPKSVSQSQIDVERLEVQKTLLEKEQAEHNQKLLAMEVDVKAGAVDAARLERLQRRIVAPLDGVVVEAAARLGEWLEPGELAFRLVNTNRLKAEGFVTAQQAQSMAVGDSARLTLAGEPQSYSGRLVFISPEIDPINNQVRVWAEIENEAGRLRPGQRAELLIQGGVSPPQ